MIKAHSFALTFIGLAALGSSLVALAASSNPGATMGSPSPALQRFVIELPDPPLALYDGRELSAPDVHGARRLPATAVEVTGEANLDPWSCP